ncbi:MAG TPA: hypothetical protein VG603_13490 [Chitinophagales bacterium]|nr:hypothetical protein [Chitinophagales bacterium]
MKTITIKTVGVIMVAVITLSMNSCKKQVVSPKTGTASSQTDNFRLADVVLNEGLNNAFSFNSHTSHKTASANDIMSSCAIVTVDSVTKPHVATVDYGTGCLGGDGHTRAGKIVITYDNADFRVGNNTFNVSYQNYVIDTTEINGSESMHNNGPDSLGRTTFTVTINTSVTQNGVTDNINGTFDYTWIAGEGSDPLQNLQFSITGSITGNDKDGNSSTATVTKELIKNYKNSTCNYVISGTILVTEAGYADKTIDYGDGTCTGMETITVNGVSTVKAQ